MIENPFGEIVKYDSPDGKGFYVKPTQQDAPDGWGEPRKAENGDPIKPGTPGGPHSNTLLRKKSGVFKPVSFKYMQKGGCITWWGKYIKETTPSKGRYVLSYNGPKLRYFRDEDFTYGSDPSHNEIYYKGLYAAVAPAPVLGACLRKMPFTDPVTEKTQDEWWIFAAVLEEGNDVFYRKPMRQMVQAYAMTDEVRAARMALYDEEDNPYGWEKIGSIPKQEGAYTADTPWFFNESGTQAACMRRKKVEFNNGFADVEEDAFDKYVVDISEESISFSNNGNAPPFAYREEMRKEHPPVYVSNDYDYPEYTHEWQEDHVYLEVTMTGEQFVMCDYLGDVLHYGKVKYDMYKMANEFFTIGLDPSPYPGPPTSNNGQTEGPYPLPENYVPSPADHYHTVWHDNRYSVILYFGPNGDEESLHEIWLMASSDGTSDEWEGRERSNDNPYLYFFSILWRWPIGMLDMRKFTCTAYEGWTYGLIDGTSMDVNYDATYKLFTEENTEGEQLSNDVATSVQGVDMSWTHSIMETWPETFDFTIDRTTYSGAWPSDNWWGDTHPPGSRSAYGQPAGTQDTNIYGSPWFSIPELFSKKEYNGCEGNGVVNEHGDYCFHMKVKKSQSNDDPVDLSKIKGSDDVASVVGFGERFDPIGSC